MLLCSILLNTAEDNQRLALAQITPAPEKFGGADDSSTNSSPDTEDGNDDDQNDDQLARLVLMVMMTLMVWRLRRCICRR
jgi:hypothetical protein